MFFGTVSAGGSTASRTPMMSNCRWVSGGPGCCAAADTASVVVTRVSAALSRVRGRISEREEHTDGCPAAHELLEHRRRRAVNGPRQRLVVDAGRRPQCLLDERDVE